MVVLIFGALRLRFSWWPLHPIIFLVWATWPMQAYCHSFLLGWFIKKMVMKYGGADAYRRFRPFMIGVIIGDILGGAVFMAVGAIYYAATGLEPMRYIIFTR